MGRYLSASVSLTKTKYSLWFVFHVVFFVLELFVGTLMIHFFILYIVQYQRVDVYYTLLNSLQQQAEHLVPTTTWIPTARDLFVSISLPRDIRDLMSPAKLTSAPDIDFMLSVVFSSRFLAREQRLIQVLNYRSSSFFDFKFLSVDFLSISYPFYVTLWIIFSNSKVKSDVLTLSGKTTRDSTTIQ